LLASASSHARGVGSSVRRSKATRDQTNRGPLPWERAFFFAVHPEETMDTVTGGEILRRCLVQEGVDVMFGYPGGAILPFYDALHGQSAPRHVLVRHEQNAAFAADGY